MALPLPARSLVKEASVVVGFGVAREVVGDGYKKYPYTILSPYTVLSSSSLALFTTTATLDIFH